jgi:NAD(P)-dependent dehydrogenase (short-subunit alcohol dehydrogenase family)
MSGTNGSGTGTLTGRTALVTGGSRGIGQAISLELARRGADVAVNYRASQAEAEDVARAIGEMGRRCVLVPGHVGESFEAREIVKRTQEEFGRLDVLVNNAGITRDRSIRKLTDEEWHEVIRVNLDGVYYTTTAGQSL